MALAVRPPSPRRQPIMGHLMGFRRDPLNFLLDAARDYGDLVHFKFGPQDIFFINHPDTVRDVLVTNNRNFTKSRGLEMAKRFLGEGLLTSEGEFHRRQRRLAQPAFHHKRIPAYADVMAEYGARRRARWQDGETLDIAQEMMSLTLGIVGKALFDADVEGEAREIGEALTDIMHMFDRITTPFPWLLELLPLPSNFRFARARARLDETIYRIINERRSTGEDRGDLLSMLLLATDTEGDGTGMSDRQLRDEAMTIFLAGHETTANALTWTWYLLSEHPEVEARLHAEIDSVLEDKLPTAEDFSRLPYTEMVLAEAMRLYPPAWAIGRRAIADYQIGEYTVPARAIILMSPYVMHRDPRFYPEPARFAPERWTTEAREARPKFAYFPFGGGPRVCIGEGFAWMEGVLLLATIAQAWRMRLAPGQRVAPRPMITLRAKNGIHMRLEKRASGQLPLITRKQNGSRPPLAHRSSND
jgi:cytochrome P450